VRRANSLRADIIEPLEKAREHVIDAMAGAGVTADDEVALVYAMRALLEIQTVLDVAKNELYEDDPAEEPCAPVDPAPSEIRDMASALASKARPG
jgi:hypothetical protein